MSALSDLYRDESDSEGSSFADEGGGRGEGSEVEASEETLEESDRPMEDVEESESGREGSDRRGSDEEDESEERDRSESEKDRSESERSREEESYEDQDRSSTRENEDQSDRKSDRDETETENDERKDQSESGYGTESDGEDEGKGKARGYDGEDPTENFHDEEKPLEAPPGAGSGGGGMSSSQKTCFFCCCLICMLIALVAGAVIGAILTDEDQTFKTVLGLESSDDEDVDECSRGGGVNVTRPPISQDPPTGVFSCSDDTVNLEFRIVFDAKPGEVGLRVTDPFNLDMWGFPPGSFGSFALLLRENIFTLCLNPDQIYTFEVTDEGQNGFISSLSTDVFGSFSLLYAEQLVTTYHGDCDADNSIECGNFCKCTYELAVNASAGSCTSDCGFPTAAPAIATTASPTLSPTTVAPSTTADADGDGGTTTDAPTTPTTPVPTNQPSSTTIQPTEGSEEEI